MSNVTFPFRRSLMFTSHAWREERRVREGGERRGNGGGKGEREERGGRRVYGRGQGEGERRKKG
jgi:hypothetical protein